jgi:glycosyltransferase involved in cell wall biosynthesis
MKILYIVPKINSEGGVARVLSTKVNYLVEKFGYEVHIITQNGGNKSLFYNFNSQIVLHDMILKGIKPLFFFQYVLAVNKLVFDLNPNIIVVCDNGLKAFTVPFFLKIRIPIFFECHGSKFIKETQNKDFLFFTKLKLLFKVFSANKFSKFIALSNESLKEWNVENGVVITNPLWLQPVRFADLKSKKVIVVARHSYEKGLDRLLIIWKKVVQKHPDWTIDIYGKYNDNYELKTLCDSLKINESVNFLEPTTNIKEKYLEASILVMTSRTEGFGMVLIEAMASGLPCVAYDCPCGPRSIIQNNENGFLVEDGNLAMFVDKMELLIEDEMYRIKIGKNAQKSVGNYNINFVMEQWKVLFESFV